MATLSRGSNFDPPKLDISVDRYSAFMAWEERWEDYVIVTKLTDESAEYQSSTLRYMLSEETRKIYETFGLNEADKKNPKAIIDKLKEFAKGTVNESMERSIFNRRYQEEDEPFDDFLTEIKHLSKNCSFCAT